MTRDEPTAAETFTEVFAPHVPGATARDLEEWLKRPDVEWSHLYQAADFVLPPRLIDDEHYACIYRMSFGKGRIAISTKDDWSGWAIAYCYETMRQAIDALLAWDPKQATEPTGWIRSLPDGRRRPDGDPSREYVAR